jgi:hypothetical protein
MSQKTFAFPATGVDPVVIGQHDTHLDLAGPYGLLQLSCSGLDGGTYKVEVMVPSNPDLMQIGTGIAANTVTVVSLPAVILVKVTFAGTGAGAHPIVHLSQRGRAFAFGSGS